MNTFAARTHDVEKYFDVSIVKQSRDTIVDVIRERKSFHSRGAWLQCFSRVAILQGENRRFRV